MAYLSNEWSLAEVAAWVATRDPNSLAEATLADFAGDGAKPAKIKAADALAVVLVAISGNRVRVRALDIRRGSIQTIPAREQQCLEFHIARDIPSSPHGFRTIQDKILRWVSPVLSAADVLSCWPRGRETTVL